MDPNIPQPQYPPANAGQMPMPNSAGVPAYQNQMPAPQGYPQYPAPQQQYPAPNPYQPNMPGQPSVTQAPTSAPRPKANPNSTQNTLQIAEVRDGIVIMNDGSFRSVVMLKSINFDLMSPQEQEAVEYSFQGFLNSLYFDIQIFIRSRKVDIGPYIEKLDKIRSEHDNMLLALLMEDYIGYMSNLAMQTNIMDKNFYLVIPYSPVPDIKQLGAQSKNFFSGLGALFSKTEKHVTINEADLNKAKDELRNRVQAVLNGLMQSGVQGLPLDTQELIELYYDTYNPDTATRQQLKNFDDLTAPIISKGAGNAAQPNLERQMQ